MTAPKLHPAVALYRAERKRATQRLLRRAARDRDAIAEARRALDETLARRTGATSRVGRPRGTDHAEREA